MTEQWRDVPGWEGLYAVSSEGRIRSLRSGRYLALVSTSRGYLRVKFSRPGEVRYARVHRVVLEAFVGPCPDDMQGCHGNGDRKDNRLENLRWDTQSANMQDCVRHGTHYTHFPVLNAAAKTKPTRCQELGHDVQVQAHGRRRCRDCQRVREMRRPLRKRDRRDQRARAEAIRTQK